MINDAGPAFPATWTNDSDGNATAPDGSIVPPGHTIALQGMSLRDWYAGLAMEAFTGNMVMNDKVTVAKLQAVKLIDALDDLAVLAFATAEAMLRARARG